MIAPGYANRMATRICSLAATLFLSAAALAGTAMDVRSGHAGHWYAAERSGEGWVLELRDAGNAWLYWFTYDEQGRQRWLTAAGQVVTDGEDGQRIDFPQLVVTRGARFGAAFNPDEVIREAVGSASLHFDGCDSGRFSYSAFNQSQSFDVQRLARVMGTRCETPHGVTGREVADFAGQSGSWYDPAHNGEGYALHWATPEQAIVTWYSYDNQGNQYWMLGTGQLDGEGRIHFPDVHATRGARFGAAFDPEDVERFTWGELTFELACDGGSASYQSTLPAFGSGGFDLARLTELHEVACPWQRPKLTDLYDIEVNEVPAMGATGSTPWTAVVNGGRVFGTTTVGYGDTLILNEWRAGAGVSVVPDGWPGTTESVILNPMLFSADGMVRIASSRGQSPQRWTPEAGWHSLGIEVDSPYAQIYATAVSADGRHVAGYGPVAAGGLYPAWRWSVEGGFEELADVGVPPQGVVPGRVYPAAISNDGIVAGSVARTSVFMRPMPSWAIRHANALSYEQLFGVAAMPLGAVRTASADGATVFGSGVGGMFGDAADPQSLAAWYWLDSGGHGELGSIGQDVDPCYPVSASADGTMVVGRCGWAGAGDVSRPFVWTSHTGMQALAELVADDMEGFMKTHATAMSADGGHILLSWRRRANDPALNTHLLTLRPRAGQH